MVWKEIYFGPVNCLGSYWKTSRFVVFQFAETPFSAVLHISTNVAWSHLCNFRLTSHFKAINILDRDFNKNDHSILNYLWNWKTKLRTSNKPKFYNVFILLTQNSRENNFHIKDSNKSLQFSHKTQKWPTKVRSLCAHNLFSPILFLFGS